MGATETDEHHLCGATAPNAAALVADAAGLIAVSGSLVAATGDPTAHAAMTAVRRAMRDAARQRLGRATLYAAAEPCPMCTAAAFYAGIDRIVFARPAADGLRCHAVLAGAPRPVAVIGPVEVPEA